MSSRGKSRNFRRPVPLPPTDDGEDRPKPPSTPSPDSREPQPTSLPSPSPSPSVSQPIQPPADSFKQEVSPTPPPKPDRPSRPSRPIPQIPTGFHSLPSRRIQPPDEDDETNQIVTSPISPATEDSEDSSLTASKTDVKVSSPLAETLVPPKPPRQVRRATAPSQPSPPTISRVESFGSVGSSSSTCSSSSTSISLSISSEAKIEFPNFPTDKRSQVALEIWQTEATYTEILKGICNVYLNPLKEAGDILDSKEIQNVFSNIEAIRDKNLEFFSEITQSLRNWEESTPEKHLLGDLFCELVLKLPIYTVFCNNFDNAIQTLTIIEKKNSSYRDFAAIAFQNPVSNNLRLQALLITPVQRIPRYCLLVKELADKTPEGHPDLEKLKIAFKKIQEVADYVNQSLKDSENVKKMTDLRKNITGLSNLESPNRSLVKEGPVSLITPKKKYQCVLFNDVLVFASRNLSKTFDVQLVLSLDTIWTEDLDDLDPQTINRDAFEVYTPDRPYTIYAGKSSEKKLWLTAIRQATAKLLEVDDSSNIIQRENRNYTYKDGSGYTGDWDDARRHGHGKYTWPSRTTYEGSWNNDQQEGQGLMSYSTGEKYSGEWKENLPNGTGTLTLVDGNEFVGNWKGGRKCGHGKIIHANGDIFEGTFEDDVIINRGKLICTNGTSYEGDWLNSQWHGQGILTVAGDTYTGNFVFNTKMGYGEMNYADGSKYAGEWKENKRHGQGVFTSSTNDLFTGVFFSDFQDGEGVLEYSNKDRFEGFFSRGLRHGKGTLLYSNGTKYVGYFTHDVITTPPGTKGVFSAPNGLRYEGSFLNGLYEGQGEITYPNGNHYKGTFKSGRREGEGILTWVDKTVYVGGWQNDKRHGQGRWKGIGSNAYVGSWLNDFKDGKGILTADTGKYDGQFKADMRHGRGVFTTLVGTKYEGEWRMDQKVGKGVLTYINGNTELLTWNNNTLISPGIDSVAPEIPVLVRPGFTS
eukprot:Lithocolla_globosa_v1_NODE_676_length_3461_cov_5.990018.p1 type:complete len:977 gc:universal NODE_676_length_3461_cov_5.990018:519-3449(+)